MRRMLYFLSEHKRVVTLMTALFLSVSMMLMGQSAKTRFARAVTVTIFNTGRYAFSWGIYITDLWDENKRLRFENLQLSEQISRRDVAVRENERLRRLLGFSLERGLSGTAIPAMVVGTDSDRMVNALILDVGTRSGVERNMAVVTAEGLVGRVFEVYPTASSVQIIRDLDSRVSAMADGINGIVRWEGGSNLGMYGLPLSGIPEEGAKVYTTGLGGVYPGGLLIGTVTGQTSAVERYASVNVVPAVDFSGIHEIFILPGTERGDIWQDGGGPFPRPEVQ